MKKETKNNKEDSKTKEIKEYVQSSALTMRFLSARSDLAEIWMMLAYQATIPFKEKERDIIRTFLVLANHKFITSIQDKVSYDNPDCKISYNLATVCRNKKGEERMIIGMDLENKEKPTYHYLDDQGKTGACNESSMTSWMEKR